MGRTLAVLVLGLACFATTVLNAYYDVTGYGYIGLASTSVEDGRAVTAVDPGSPAAEAGLRPGDIVDERGRMDLRVTLFAGAYEPGRLLILPVLREGRPFVATVTPARRYGTPSEVALDIAEALFSAIFIGIAGWLACARRSFMTARLFATSLAYALVGGLPTVRMLLLNPEANLLAALGGSALVACGTVGIFVFCTRVPDGKAIGRWRAATSPIPVGVTIAVIAVAYAASFAIDLGDLNRLAYPVYIVGSIAVVVAGLWAFIERYRTTQRDQRRRLRWIATGFASVVVSAVSYFALVNAGSGSAAAFALFFNVWPYTVLYALVAPRVTDVKIGIARALVYGAVIAVPVVVLVTVDSSLHTPVSDNFVVLLIEIAAAVLCGFTAYTFRGRLDGIAERMFFSKRRRARLRLSATAVDVVASNDRNAINDRIVTDAYDVLDLAACAVYREIRGAFVRTHARGALDTLPPQLAHNTALVVALRSAPPGTFDIVRLRRSTNGNKPAASEPRLAFPFHVRTQLAGFLLVSAHSDGDPLTEIETVLLENVALAASASYDRITSEEAFAELERRRTTPPAGALPRIHLPAFSFDLPKLGRDIERFTADIPKFTREHLPKLTRPFPRR